MPFNISNAQIGLGSMAYALMGSLSQPFFGVLADRFGGRWLGAIGLLWTAVFYYAATFSQNYFTLIALMTVASLGSGAFHPQGAMNAGAAGGHKATTGTSVFFLLGQMGLAIGPMVAGVLLEEIWMDGPRYMAVATLPFVVWMAYGLRKPLVRVQDEPAQARPVEQRPRSPIDADPALQSNRRWPALVAFAVLVALRASVHQIFYGLLPKYFSDLGFSPREFGFMVGVPSVAIALGSMTGGILGDRYEQPKIVLWSLLAATPFSWLMLDIVEGWLFFPLAFAAGFLVGIPHSILVVMAQRFPAQQAGFGQRRHPRFHLCLWSFRHRAGRPHRRLLQSFSGHARCRPVAPDRRAVRRLPAHPHHSRVPYGPRSRFSRLTTPARQRSLMGLSNVNPI